MSNVRHHKPSLRGWASLLAGKLLLSTPEATMPTLVEELSKRARSLSPEDRARLAEELLASLDDAQDVGADAAWEKEVGRRVEEIKSGRARLIPAEDVFAETARLYK